MAGGSRPVLILSGDPGVGKTTLARQIADRCGAHRRVALIGHLRAQLVDLPHQVPKAFGLAPDRAFGDAEQGAETVRRALRDAGGQALLIVDEAQALSDDGLDYLALLTGAADGETRPLTVLLIDGGDLQRRLAVHDGLRSRVGGRFRLVAFDEAETAAYIAHRFRVSGCSCHAGVQVFDESGARRLHALSGGVPRVIDTLVQRCLFQAAMTGQTAMDADFVRSCLATLAEDGGLAHLVVPGSARPVAKPAGAEAVAASLRPENPPAVQEDPPVEPVGRVKPLSDPVAVMPQDPGRRGPVHAMPGTPWKAGLAAAAAGLLILFPIPGNRGSADAVATASLLPLAPVLATAMQGVAGQGSASGRIASVPLMPGRARVEDAPDPDRLLSDGLAIGGADPARAARLYARAALWGNDRAAYYLGQLYETGVGVGVDLDRAKGWYEQAPDLRGAAARLADLRADEPAKGSEPPASPIPVRQVLFKAGQTELHWQGDAPRFRVEYVPAGGRGSMRSFETALSGALIPHPVARWRVVPLRRDGSAGPASPWSRPVPAAR